MNDEPSLHFDFNGYHTRLKTNIDVAVDQVTTKYPELGDNVYPKELILLIEKSIEAYGNAYCMDVKSERKKIARLVYDLLLKTTTKR